MQRNRLLGVVAIAALAGVAACGGNDTGADSANVANVDTVVQQDTTTMQVPVTVPDSQAVVTTVDTSKDTVDIGSH
ncbi:MAG TPA: hypothetical protein VFL93_16345 [Longimicrobiaceae bacterium]|nr:hypothetical protein [Longimicrobiaceae bacterium]